MEKRNLFVTGVLVLLLCAGTFATTTALTEYVNKFDPTYHWNMSQVEVHTDDYSVYNLYLTSQEWLTPADSDRHIWYHWVQVCVPANIDKDNTHAMLFVDGGKNKNFDQPPNGVDTLIHEMCSLVPTSISAAVFQIPNQPIVFGDDPTHRGRSEDAMIAWTWAHFINDTFETDWLARMPMTKASVKAMDALQEWSKQRTDVPDIEKFVVGGASKRGWTTWMVGAMGDPRVSAIMPIVAPIANLTPQINEMWESYGEWSFALKDYYELDLMNFLNLPVFEELLYYIDPLTYLEEMKGLPKYVIGACGDEFFMPDAQQYYWEQLPGPKYLRQVPNAEHSLATRMISVINSAAQYYLSIVNGTKLPEYSYEISSDGATITLTTQSMDGFVGAKVYFSRNNKARDWRLVTCPEVSPKCVNLATFANEPLQESSPGVFTYTLEQPKNGTYSAFLIELEYDFDHSPKNNFIVTSDVSIIPKAMPYPRCPVTTCACGYRCPNQSPNFAEERPSSSFEAPGRKFETDRLFPGPGRLF